MADAVAGSAPVGFTVAAADFYEDLENDNTKSFWTAHKQDYETLVRAPMVALTDALADEFGPAKIFRPYRDVRFSADKTPYKTHQGAYVATADSTGYYVQLDASGLRVGAGWYGADSRAKTRYREAVDGRAGAALERILAGLTDAGYALGGDKVRTQPRGWPADHRRIELLRHNTLTLMRSYGTPDWMSTPGLAVRVAEDWRALTPLLEWHRKHVAA
ncbi:uncharacterized protein (TIGR02453 family) [Mumia flava]|uniref:Uncharacterized protein (TIGR02453 family) n=1 Tax=Mumia flava TaxID=1348852 RepID=A0A0B2BH85_9ACTN|nr:DUF2461 domain-containing protein [Mumia flava]PJJ56253.1 uncharacterized protein (TIGR02453 family) [Mumia flava]